MFWFKLPEGTTSVSVNGLFHEVVDGVFAAEEALAERILKEIPGVMRIGPPEVEAEVEAMPEAEPIPVVVEPAESALAGEPAP